MNIIENLRDKYIENEPIYPFPIFTLNLILVGILLGVVFSFFISSPSSAILVVGNILGNKALTILTGIYAFLTLVLVVVTHKSRRDEIKRKRKQRDRQRENIRRAFLLEIESMINKIDDIDTSRTNTRLGMEIAKTTVFEKKVDDLGQLTKEESKSIIESYHKAIEIRRLLKRGMAIEEDRYRKGMTGISSSQIESLREELETARDKIRENL